MFFCSGGFGVWGKMATFVYIYRTVIMQNKLFQWVIALVVCLSMTACNSDSFKLEGALTDANGQTLRAIYINEAGVHTVFAPVQENRFTVEGASANYTVLCLYNEQNVLLTKVVLKNGENLKMRGTMKHNYLIEMKGSDENEDWNAFRRENHMLYDSEDKIPLLDKKIEEYIEANGKKMASLLLLLYDYNGLDNTARVRELLNMIDEKVRPAAIMRSYAEMNSILSQNKAADRKLQSLSFYNEKDSLETFMPVRSNMSVLCFWEISDESRDNIVNELDSLYSDFKGKKRLQIADIMLDSDTTKWKRTLRKEDKDWKHYWAVGGVMNKSIKDLMIKKSPEFIVLDSIGQQVYRGDSIMSVKRLVREHFNDTVAKKK